MGIKRVVGLPGRNLLVKHSAPLSPLLILVSAFLVLFPGQVSSQEAAIMPAPAQNVAFNPVRQVSPASPVKYGVASWYSESDPFINLHTANGEIFDDSKMTCASWYHPFGTMLEVTNLENGLSVVCRVNDRGPAKRLNRLIDLTRTAFAQIASPRRGLVKVAVREVAL